MFHVLSAFPPGGTGEQRDGDRAPPLLTKPAVLALRNHFSYVQEITIILFPNTLRLGASTDESRRNKMHSVAEGKGGSPKTNTAPEEKTEKRKAKKEWPSLASCRLCPRAILNCRKDVTRERRDWGGRG